MIELIPISEILPNPWQPRTQTDPEHIRQLADSIRANGLLQIPTARRCFGNIELAFGHSRLAAYKLLAQEDPEKWGSMPLNVLTVAELSDEQIARVAIEENVQRKDLNPLEEATAMKRFKEQFEKTSEQVGELFGLSDGAVRNKMRLLDLPESIQAGFTAGTMTESAGRELLSLLALPERMQKDSERSYTNDYKVSAIVHDAVNGAMASSIHARIEMIIQQNSENLFEAPWQHDETIRAEESGAEKNMPACIGCPHRLVHGKKTVCLDKTCFWEKHKAWKGRYLRRASDATGYPALDPKNDSCTDFYGYGTMKEALKTAIAAKCPNLRVAYGVGMAGAGGLDDEGYPKAHLVCQKRNGFCTCHQAVNAGVSLERENSESPEAAAAPITIEELSEVAKEARKEKRANLAECRELLERAAWIIGEALYDAKPGAWRLILDHNSWQWRDKEISEVDVRFELGRLVAAGIFNAEGYSSPDPAHALEEYNKALRKHGLPEIVSTETEVP